MFWKSYSGATCSGRGDTWSLTLASSAMSTRASCTSTEFNRMSYCVNSLPSCDLKQTFSARCIIGGFILGCAKLGITLASAAQSDAWTTLELEYFFLRLLNALPIFSISARPYALDLAFGLPLLLGPKVPLYEYYLFVLGDSLPLSDSNKLLMPLRLLCSSFRCLSVTSKFIWVYGQL